MPAPDPDIFEAAKEKLKTRFETVGDELTVITHEPLEAKSLPLLSIMTSGFARAGLETNAVQGPGELKDALMRRTWILIFNVRLWIPLTTDAEAAQKKLDVLLPQIVRALEADKSLDRFAVDSAMSRGDVGKVTPRAGQALLMVTSELAVEVEEDSRT